MLNKLSKKSRALTFNYHYFLCKEKSNTLYYRFTQYRVSDGDRLQNTLAIICCC